jgi:hypothetical protein
MDITLFCGVAQVTKVLLLCLKHAQKLPMLRVVFSKDSVKLY